MTSKRIVTIASAIVVALGAVALIVRAQSRPTVNISPEAKVILDGVSKAYAALQTLTLAGDVSLQFEGAGKAESQRSEFTATFAAPNKFRHDLKDDLTIVSTGEKLTIYSVALNQFVAADLKTGEKIGDEAPPVLTSMLGKQNPSLLAAIGNDPIESLTAGATDVTAGPDETVDGKPHSSLLLSRTGIRVTLLIDKSSHLLRRVTADMREQLASQVPDLKSAAITIDYRLAESGKALKGDAFAFDLPKDAKPAAVDMPDSGEFNQRAMALVGKPAPELKLKDLAGAEVDISALKGTVVVLDFWATWCPPCKESLPGYARLAKEYAERNAPVKMFTVNLAEAPAKVRQYLEGEGLTVPTLLDTRGEAGDRYGAEAIPVTFVIDKNGIVASVVTGASETQITDAITKASQ